MEEWAAPIFGAMLIAVGGAMMLGHSKSWKEAREQDDLEESELKFQGRRFRRRMQASGLMVIIGILIPLGDRLPILRQRADLWVMFWALVFVAVIWMALLALADVISTQAHARVALGRVQRKQRELQQELTRLKARQGNGHAGHHGDE